MSQLLGGEEGGWSWLIFIFYIYIFWGGASYVPWIANNRPETPQHITPNYSKAACKPAAAPCLHAQA